MINFNTYFLNFSFLKPSCNSCNYSKNSSCAKEDNCTNYKWNQFVFYCCLFFNTRYHISYSKCDSCNNSYSYSNNLNNSNYSAKHSR